MPGNIHFGGGLKSTQSLRVVVLVGLLLTFLLTLLLVVLAAYNSFTCAKWEETGGLSCYASGSFTTCQPEVKCVERK